MNFSSLEEFDKELHHLSKKYRTLESDLDVLKSILEKYPNGLVPRIFRIPGLGVQTEVYKVKHFHCQAMKNKGARSGIRVIYAYFPNQEKPDQGKIEFVEIYYKEKDDRDCDKERIKQYYPWGG